MEGWKLIFWGPTSSILSKIGDFLLIFIGAMAILLLGWIIARVLSGLVQKVFQALKFNDVANKYGLTDILNKGGVTLTPTALLGALVYWAVIIVALAVTVDAIGLTVAADILEKIIGYIPNVIVAVFVVFIGMFVAGLISGAVRTMAANANLPRAEFLASISKGAILVLTAVLALDALNIASFFVTTTFQIFFAAVCFMLALAFGLGGKDLAAKVLWDFYNKQNMNK
ncbi:MAG: hypothetical protein GX606_06785 [Elusimicrobia bacterium]|nr:hypothetical protein [Elusimicrobiota bacterium]